MPSPMPLISRGCPAYTNDDYGGSFPANHANDATYGGTDYWRCITAPISNTDSGTLTQAVYLAYDLSGVASASRGQVLLHWDQSATTGAYNCQLIGNNAFNIPTGYTIDVNAAAGGGSAPSSGWVTLVTVTGSAPYHSRQHLVDMTGYNWIRMNVTAVTGSLFNNNVALNMDVHNAASGAVDSWFMAGDSITQFAFIYSEQAGLSTTLTQQIANAFPAYYPVWEDGGIAGWTATDVQAVFSTWLALFPGKYVTLNLGTNDANQGGAYLTTFSAKMTNMVQQVLAAGKIPVIPQIPWGGTAGLLANVPTLNTQITAIIAANPGAIAGPDLYTYFAANQSLIDSDNIHPTNPAGYNAYRTQWVNWAIANIYRNVLVTQARSTYKVRTALRTVARSTFTIKLVNTGPKPYMVTQVATKIVPRPFTTINSQATVIDASSTLQSTLNATVTVTFPDASTATPTVYSLGSGVYSTSYTTKGVGTIGELWLFTDGQSGQIEYQNEVVCSY